MESCLIRDEFIVDSENVDLIKNFKDKIEKSFEIKIQFDEVAEVDDSKSLKQWISVEGENVDRKNAREYIIALCQPLSVQRFDVRNSHVESETIEQIEKQTSAVLFMCDKDTIEIRGSELAVILAMSSLESYVMRNKINDTETDSCPQPEGATNKKGDLGGSVWSKEIDTRLQRVLSSQSENSVSLDDYNKTSPSVKMTILKCMNDFDDISDQDLFPSSEDQHTSYKVPVFLEGEQINRSLFVKKNAGTGSSSSNVNEEMEIDGVLPMNNSSPSGVTNLADRLIGTEISSDSETMSNDANRNIDEKEIQYLRTFGISVGYDDDIVEEGLKSVNAKTKPADFLERLDAIQTSKKQQLKGQESEASGNNFPPPPSAPSVESSGSGHGSFGRRSLPKEYKDRLLIDFNEENENLPVEELKKRNAERQKMLKMAFDTVSTQESPAPTAKKKRRKKKNKKKKQTENNQEQKNQDGASQVMNKNEAEKKSNDVIVISSEEEEGEDDDETCVLEVWESPNNVRQTNITAGSSNVMVERNTDHMPIVSLPKKKPQNIPPNKPPFVERSNPRQQFQPPNPWTGQHGQQFRGQGPMPQRHPYPRNPRPLIPYLPQGPIRHQVPPRPYYYFDNNQRPRQQNTEPFNNRQPGYELRYIVIDGSNVAMGHGNGKFFSCKGIKIVIDYFLNRGHKHVTAFVPEWRKYSPRPDTPIKDQDILTELKEDGHLVFTPSRRINGRLITSYDDRYVLSLAETEDGIIVSNDQYRDLMREKASWKKIIEDRLLLFSFVGDNFMPPEDPLGRNGPTLTEFLQKQPSRKRLASPPQRQWDNHPPYGANRCYDGQFVGGNQNFPRGGNQNFPALNNVPDSRDNRGMGQGNRGQGQGVGSPRRHKQNDRPLRNAQKTDELADQLKAIFPNEQEKIVEILQNHPCETDPTKLTNYLMNALCD
ncbi:hypothetical protein FSP39_012303 [Pinctada imbricata]|uniref:RNase NYN domain-containing protein n=1 Tax=Pinctada imbricata TaxID=66713 RepID=A0AA89BKL0_PINIB|nr:hypothetical protein FSP39_012303 [Pinctada imbricata]